MSKILKTILAVILASSVVFIMPKTVLEVEAATGCSGSYEVATINDDGSFNKVDCKSNFADAKALMKTLGDDAVVRHEQSYSPTQIIAMNSGIVYSYPVRSDSQTLIIYGNLEMSSSAKQTYIMKHREMTFSSAESYDGAGNGKIKVQVNGFIGYVLLKNVDLVPMKFITNGIKITLGGRDVTSENEQPFTLNVKQSHYTVVQNGNYKDLVYKAYSGFNTTEYSYVVGKAADWMSVGGIYYSWDNCNFYSDRKYANYVGTYYNYYQFLPFRSKTNISADTFNSFLYKVKKTTAKPSGNTINSLAENESQLYNEGQTFIDAQNTYGMNALLTYAMACHESTYGRSKYAVEKNNLFGWNAVDSNPDNAKAFNSIYQAITEHMGVNLRGLADTIDARFFADHLGNKGSGFNVKYASDPYWGASIAALAYEIDKFANGYNGNLTDNSVYTLGVISNDANVPFKKEANSGSGTLFNSTFGNGYQKNFMVIILNQTNDWYQVQLTNGLYSNGSLITHRDNGQSTGGNINGLIPYDFNLSRGYLATNQVTLVNKNNTPVTPPSTEGTVPTGNAVSTVTKFEWNGDKLSIAGQSYRPGIYVTSENTITQTLKIENQYLEGASIQLSATLAGKDQSSFSKTDIDLSSLAIGTYTFKLSSSYSKYTAYNNSFYVPSVTLPAKKDIGNKTYVFKVENNVVKLVVSKKLQVEVEAIYAIDQFEWTNKDELFIKGVGLIQGIDNSNLSKITKYLDIINIETKEVVKSVVLDSLDISKNMFDGFDYKYGWFSGNINIQDLPVAEYRFVLRFKVDDIEKSKNLIDTDKSLIPEKKQLTSSIDNNQYYYTLLQNTDYSYRYELKITKNDVSVISVDPLPTRRTPVVGFDKIEIVEATDKIIFVLDGLAYIRNADFKSQENVKYSLILDNESAGVSEEELTTKKCSVDYQKRYNSTYDLNYICFEGQIDITNFENGKYNLYIKIDDNSSSGKHYTDLGEIKTDYDTINFSLSNLEKVFNLKSGGLRGKINLIISKK